MPSRSSRLARVAGSCSMPSARPRTSAATSSSSASRPASRSASASNRGSRRARPRDSRTAIAAASRAPAPSAVSASRTAAAPRAIASPCWAADSRARISSASPGRSLAAAISAASCSRRSTRRASSRGSIDSSASAARFARQRSTTSAVAARAAACPPYASSRSRCQRSSSRRCWSCWPWISTSGPTSSASRDAVVAMSSRRAVDRPSVGDLANRDQRLGQSVEQGLDPRGLGAVADEARVRPRPADEPERVDQQALAGAGLAGDDVEARPERQAQPVDQRQVADGELEQAAGRRLATSALTTAAAPPCGAAGPRTVARPPAR